MPLLANINVGSAPNDGTGDSIRDSFITVNENFQFVESFFPNTDVISLTANITSTGNSAFNNLTITGTTTSAGNISANYLFGNGSQLSAVVAGTAIFVTGNAQGNITSVGNLTGLLVSGGITAATVFAGTIGNTGAALVGNISTAAQPNITSVGTLTSLTLSGNITGVNIFAGTIGNTGAALVGNISTAAQPNITSVGTLSSLVTGNISGSSPMLISNVLVIAQSVTNEIGDNPTTSNIRFATNRSQFNAFNVNANVTFLYPAPITFGIVKTVHVKNISGATQYIILPNSNNNKGGNIIPVSNGTVTTFTFVPYDTTEANVMATITND